MESLERTVDHWIENPPPRRFVYFASNTDTWQKHPYAELAELAMQIAHGLHRVGVRRNDAVAIDINGRFSERVTFFCEGRDLLDD